MPKPQQISNEVSRAQRIDKNLHDEREGKTSNTNTSGKERFGIMGGRASGRRKLESSRGNADKQMTMDRLCDSPIHVPFK